MAKLSIKAGTTSKTVDVMALNNTSTKGAGLTGLVYNSTNLQAYYYREGAASDVAISLATATLGTWATGGFVAMDGTNMPGMYQLSIPNLALAAGAKSVKIYIWEITTTALNLAPIVLEIELTATNNQDGIAGGMTALPQTACTTNASLLTSGTGADQLQVNGSGKVSEVVLCDTLTTYTSNTPQTGDAYGQLNTLIPHAFSYDGSNLPYISVHNWLGSLVSVNVAGIPVVDVGYTLGTISQGAAGYVGIDWAAIDHPTHTNNLSGTTISTSQNVNNVLSLTDSAGNPFFSDVISSPTIQTAYSTAQVVINSTANIYPGDTMEFVFGTGKGQKRTIANITGGTTLIPDRAFTVAPDATTTLVIRRKNEFALNTAAISWTPDGNGYPQVGVADINGIAVETDLNGYLCVNVQDWGGSSSLTVDGVSIFAALQYIAASTAGEVSGAGTGTEIFLGLDKSTTRLTITVDSVGNRTAITYH